MAFPEEKWTWDRFDLFVIANLNYLLTDEFVDGELTPEGVNTKTLYSELKGLRKDFKSTASKGLLKEWVFNV
jgi:hypothetical protein